MKEFIVKVSYDILCKAIIELAADNGYGEPKPDLTPEKNHDIDLYSEEVDKLKELI